MAFSPIELTTVSRVQDYTTIKHNEDNKTYVDQSLIVNEHNKNDRQRSQEVTEGERSMWQEKQPDARDKGSNEYHGDGGKDRKKTKEISQVIVKGKKSFDIKI